MNPPELLHSALLTAAGFPHGFSSRRTGDFQRGVTDPGQLVEGGLLFSCRQVHGAAILEIETNQRLAEVAELEADALIARAGLAVGVRTADCVPLLLADPERGHVAAVHAGWRGVVAEIARLAVERLGGAPSQLLAALGPSIGACCFEIGAEVESALAQHDAVFTPRSNGKVSADLRQVLEGQLRRAGVSRIERVGGCTMCETERFFSYRRDQSSGRMLSFVQARST